MKSAINELLKVQVPGGAARPGAARADAATPPPNTARPASDSPSTGGSSTSIAGHWVGTLRKTGSTDTLGCDLHVASSGRPLWTYYDTNGFRQTELTQEGQKIEYVPPERGVMRVIVQSVTGSPNESG